MNKIYVKDLKEHFNEEIEFQGFIENIRDLQYVQFVVLRDSTGKVQLTIEKSEEKTTIKIQEVEQEIKEHLLELKKVDLNI